MKINNLSGYFKHQRWLVAHNAWNTNQYPGNNQSKTITELLNYGVRGFALDIYGDTLEKLHLQHAHGNPATSIKWSIILAELNSWLVSHPQDIVTLFFESYLEGPKPDVVWNSRPALVALEDSLKTIKCYRAGRSEQESAMSTLTLSQLIGLRNADGDVTGQRLFAFIEHEPDEGAQTHFPVMTKTFTENVYGDDSLDMQTWVNLREDSSANNELTFMNHFGNSPVASRWDGNETANVLKQAYAFAFNYSGRYPNFISLDEIKWSRDDSGPLAIVQELHDKEDVAISPFRWVGKNDFDDLFFDIGNLPIVSFRVENEPGRGLVKIQPLRQMNPSTAITSIQLINVARYGIVNMRFQSNNGPWNDWMVAINEKDTDVNGDNITMATYSIVNTLVGVCCRLQGGRGVTDFATASWPRDVPQLRTFRSNR